MIHAKVRYEREQGLYLHISAPAAKEVNDMVCDESLYRQYLNGDDAGLDALMKKYGDPLPLCISMAICTMSTRLRS